VQPDLSILDPLAKGSPPTVPSSLAAAPQSLAYGAPGCTVTTGCTVYSPGRDDGGITIKNQDAVFMPGVYYMNGGTKQGSTWITFGNLANVNMYIGTDDPDDSDTGQGMMVYSTRDGNLSGGCKLEREILLLAH
jgi:hypothetical protein